MVSVYLMFEDVIECIIEEDVLHLVDWIVGGFVFFFYELIWMT